MNRQFRDVVETLALDSEPPGVVFADTKGHYSIPTRPDDVMNALRTSLMTGRPVRVTCDADSLAILDAVLD